LDVAVWLATRSYVHTSNLERLLANELPTFVFYTVWGTAWCCRNYWSWRDNTVRSFSFFYL